MSRQWAQKKSGSNSSMPVQKSSSKQRPFSDPIYNAPAPKQMPSVQAKRPFDWSRVTVEAPSRAGVQAKLTVGAPGDKYEPVADAMANKVMTMPAPGSSQPIQREMAPEEKQEEVQTKPLAAAITPLVQRETAPEENFEEEVQTKPESGNIQREMAPEENKEEVQAKLHSGSIQRETAPEENKQEEVQTKPHSGNIQREMAPEENFEEEVQAKSHSGSIQREMAPEENFEEEIQAKAAPEGKSQASGNVESQLSASKGGGSALSDEVRAFMEPRFGADFSSVKVHTDGAAVQMNRDLGAQAFTHGSDIYFGAGKSPGKDELTAHELTHVVQQTGNRQIQRSPSPAPAPGVFPPSPPPPLASTPVAKLKLNADTETVNRSELTFAELQEAQVGHSWVSLTYNNNAQISDKIQEPTKSLLKSGGTAFGFWPLIFRGEEFTTSQQERIRQGQTPGTGTSTDRSHTGFSLNPLKWVPGRVEEPDTAHSPKITKEYSLTQPQVDSLMSYVNSKRNANYNLYRFNCTTFAVECVQQAGQAAPGGSSWGIALPNALYKDLYQMSKKGDKSVTTAPLESGEKHEDVKKK